MENGNCDRSDVLRLLFAENKEVFKAVSGEYLDELGAACIADLEDGQKDILADRVRGALRYQPA